jgi:hypothetical protein
MATHYANAVAIYEVVATGTLSHYLSYHNEDGALGRGYFLSWNYLRPHRIDLAPQINDLFSVC